MAEVRKTESPIRARRRKRRALLIWGVWGALMALVVLSVLLSHASFLRIQTVSIEGARTVAQQALEAHVREELEGKHFFLFPKDNIFLYPKAELAAALLLNYPTLREVVVAAEDFTTLSVAAQDREPRALWCGASLAAPEECLLLDEEGAAYAQAPEFSENPYVRYYGALVGEALPKQFLEQERFRSLAALVDAIALEQPDASVRGVEVGEDVRLVLESGFVLMFVLEDDGGDVFERFTLALTAEPFNGRALSAFEYLDLRFGDKLYYKVKEESALSEE